MFDDLRRRLADRHLRLEVTDTARRYIASAGFDPVYGARPLRRFLQREVETRIGRPLLAGDVHSGATILVNFEAGDLTVGWKQPAEAAVSARV